MSGVFISYSQADRECAQEMVAQLEAEGVRCWIAPRDISPSADWAAEIIDAISEARIMVLVFSASSNHSPQVRREVERAVHKGVAVLPFRIEQVLPSKSLEFFLSSQHWMDAFQPPRGEHYRALARYLRSHLGTREAPIARGEAAAGGVLPRPGSGAACPHRTTARLLHRPAGATTGAPRGTAGDGNGRTHCAPVRGIGCGVGSIRVRTAVPAPSGHALTRSRWPWLVLAYAVLYAIGFISRPQYGVAAIWPAHAASFAAFALLPVRGWPVAALVLGGCDVAINMLLSRLYEDPHKSLPIQLGYALANMLTTCGPVALARGLRLLQVRGRYRFVISPLWIVVLLAGVAPGALWGAVIWSYRQAAPFSPAVFGLWALAAVLTIVTLTPATFGFLLDRPAAPDPEVRPWERLGVSALMLGLFLWFLLRPWPTAGVLVQPMLFTIPLVWLAMRFSQRVTHCAVALVAAGISILFENRAGLAGAGGAVPGGFDKVVAIDVFLLIGCGGALLVNVMTFKQRALLAVLAREHLHLQQYAQALDSAEEAARRLTAADLHDGIGQVLAGQSMTLAAMRPHAGNSKLAALLEEAVEASREAQEGLRLMIQDLSPPELNRASLDEILRWLEGLFRSRFGFAIEYRLNGAGQLTRDDSQLIYRCIREMLMNACKHSGRKGAWVDVEVGERSLSVRVSDEGVGFDPSSAASASSGRFGLAQLRERARAAGGNSKSRAPRGAGAG